MFAPEQWGTLDRFQRFHGPTYSFDADTQKALRGAANQLRKALVLLQVARQHAPKLTEDKEQLEQHGHTPAQRARELSALIESILLGLYSSVDCARKVVTFIYRNEHGVKQTTRRFFQAVANGKVADSVPQEIRDAFAGADWYGEFRRMRDALTHSDIGVCHLDDSTNEVVYMHEGLGDDNKALVVRDIFAHIDYLVTQINEFMGKIFDCLNGTLKDEEVLQMCLIFGGRVYSRWVRASEATDFNGGRCDAFKWFENDENPDCPFMEKCVAYKRVLLE